MSRLARWPTYRFPPDLKNGNPKWIEKKTLSRDSAARRRDAGWEAVGFFHGDFGLVVQPLYHATGNELLIPEIVEDQLPVLTEGACGLLHWLDAGPHRLATPLIEELAGPGGRVVAPELLEGFLAKVSPDGFQVVAEQIA